MLETFLAWTYLWPFSAAVLAILFLGLLTINLLLSLCVFALYLLLPTTLIDDFLHWSVETIRKKFEDYFLLVEEHLADTFPMVNQERIPKSALLLWHPHSLMSVTPTIHCSFRIHELDTKIVSHGIYHFFPFIRDFARLANSIPANFDIMKKTLEEGHTVSVMPGGVREMLSTTDDKIIKLVIRRRRGVFKLALQTGVPLVPILTYGEDQLFPPLTSPSLNLLNELFYSFFRIAIPLTSWTAIKNWINLYYHPLDPVTTYVGEPINVEKIADPSDDEILDLRDKYIKELKKLFEETKPDGYSLVID